MIIETPLEHSFIRTNGIKLHVVQAGPADGIPLLMIHGYPDFWYGWRHQIKHFVEAGYRLIIPDQRGYNLSAKVQGVSSYKGDALAADMVGLLDALGYDTAFVAGHDWGSLTAWYTTLFYPERVRKLVCLSAPHPKVLADTLFSDPEQMRRMWYVWIFQIPYFPERMLSGDDWGQAVNMLDSSGRETSFTASELEVYRESYAHTEAMTCMINYYRCFVQHPRAIPGSWRVNVPMRLLWGTDDQFLKTQMAHDSLHYCDDAKLHILDASHWILEDARDDVNRIIEEFFAE